MSADQHADAVVRSEAAKALAKTGSELGRRLNPTGIVAAFGS
jgi:hypothetical protein